MNATESGRYDPPITMSGFLALILMIMDEKSVVALPYSSSNTTFRPIFLASALTPLATARGNSVFAQINATLCKPLLLPNARIWSM